MKNSIIIVIFSLIFNYSLNKTEELKKKLIINLNSRKITNSTQQIQKITNTFLSPQKNLYLQTQVSAENFLLNVSNLVNEDFKIIKKYNQTGITFQVLKNIINSDREFKNIISEKELKDKFNEYDTSNSGKLDKIKYSGILSEIFLAKAVVENLNKYIYKTLTNSSDFKNQTIYENFHINKIHIENENISSPLGINSTVIGGLHNKRGNLNKSEKINQLTKNKLYNLTTNIIYNNTKLNNKKVVNKLDFNENKNKIILNDIKEKIEKTNKTLFKEDVFVSSFMKKRIY